MTITVPGYTTLTGTPHAILKLLQQARIFDEESQTPEEYIKAVQMAAWRFYGITLNVTGNTPEEQASSLLQEMGKHNLIEIEK